MSKLRLKVVFLSKEPIFLLFNPSDGIDKLKSMLSKELALNNLIDYKIYVLDVEIKSTEFLQNNDCLNIVETNPLIVFCFLFVYNNR